MNIRTIPEEAKFFATVERIVPIRVPEESMGHALKALLGTSAGWAR